MGEHPVFVCGHGRCGSSLVMKMLEAGGFPVLGDFPAYEPEEVGFGRDMETLLQTLGHRAAKILDPQLSRWPSKFKASVIWLDRDHKEQAKSQIKFLQFCNPGLLVPSGAWRAVAGSFAGDTRRSVALFENAGCRMLRARFEDLLKHPFRAAEGISMFVGGLNVNDAASVVLHRSPKCAADCSVEMNGCIEADSRRAIIHG